MINEEDRGMLYNPDLWPMWPLLPLKNPEKLQKNWNGEKKERFGVLHYNLSTGVYSWMPGAMLYGLGEDAPRQDKVTKTGQQELLDELLESGWIVD